MRRWWTKKSSVVIMFTLVIVELRLFYGSFFPNLNFSPLPQTRMIQSMLGFPFDEFMRTQQAIQIERKDHLKKVCQKYHKRTPDPWAIIDSNADMIVDEKHKIVLCCTAKIAGKSWKRVFNVLTGLSYSTMEDDGWDTVVKARQINRLKNYTPESIRTIFNDFTFFMFARDPLSRILSAYSNKMAPNCTDYRNRNSFRRVGYKIIEKYRPESGALKTDDPDQYDLTFHDFVRFLIDRETLRNNHWIENYRFCLPCDMPYDIIGKYETLLDDSKYILKLTNLDGVVSFPQSEGVAGTSTFSSKPSKMRSFYRQIPVEDIEKLIERYKMDYLLFNYTIPSHDDLVTWLQ